MTKQCVWLLAAALSVSYQKRYDDPACQSDIVSATVIATFCGHAVDGSEMLDVTILWRGRAGWFQRGKGWGGSGGSRTVGGRSTVSQWNTYSGTTIGFDADFDAKTVTIGDVVVPLDRFNTVFVDRVDDHAARAITRTQWIEPHLPLMADHNLVLARRSGPVRNYLRCGVPMPPPPRMPPPPGISRGKMTVIPQPAVITVCEKLKSQ